MDEQVIQQWHCQSHHGRRGRGFHYSDTAIETALMVKGLFKLPLRALEGFINSLFQLMAVPLKSPDYSCISKRAKTVDINYRLPSQGPVAHLVIDATGLKVYGEGEWKIRKHGKEKRRVWRKLHLAVDPATHDVVAAEVSLENVHDAEVLPTLLNPLRRKLGRVYADGAYDSKASHQLISRKGATACIPPRKNAGLWKKGHPKNDAVLVMRKEGLAHWKKISGYHRSSQAETAMYRFKQLLAGKISLRNYNGQVGEVMAYVCVMNKLNALGLPVRKPRV